MFPSDKRSCRGRAEIIQRRSQYLSESPKSTYTYVDKKQPVSAKLEFTHLSNLQVFLTSILYESAQSPCKIKKAEISLLRF